MAPIPNPEPNPNDEIPKTLVEVFPELFSKLTGKPYAPAPEVIESLIKGGKIASVAPLREALEAFAKESVMNDGKFLSGVTEEQRSKVQKQVRESIMAVYPHLKLVENVDKLRYEELIALGKKADTDALERALTLDIGSKNQEAINQKNRLIVDLESELKNAKALQLQRDKKYVDDLAEFKIDSKFETELMSRTNLTSRAEGHLLGLLASAKSNYNYILDETNNVIVQNKATGTTMTDLDIPKIVTAYLERMEAFQKTPQGGGRTDFVIPRKTQANDGSAKQQISPRALAAKAAKQAAKKAS